MAAEKIAAESRTEFGKGAARRIRRADKVPAVIYGHGNDPIRRVLEHIDFVAVRRGEKVTVDIPVHLVGDAASETLVVTENTVVSVEAEATHIPEFIEVSIEGAGVGTQILASDLDLPEGSLLLTDPETLVVNITNAPTAEEVEAELEEAEAEAGIEREESDEEIAAAEAESTEGGSTETEGESTEA